MHAGTTPPPGWLERNGAAVSRTLYAALYAALGGAASPWGQGDGATTFNLPDARDDFDRGASAVRPVGTKASDTTRSHTHGYTEVGAVAYNQEYGPASGYADWSGPQMGNLPRTTAATGGGETAPRHGCYLPIIKF